MACIIGAGMAGLLAGAMFRADGQIYESAQSLPNNHHALLRFRSNDIGQYLNLPFQEVNVIKAIKRWRNPVADNIAYAMKCTGKASLRSSITADGKIARRYIASENFVEDLERHQARQIIYGTNIEKGWIDERKAAGEAIISTMPMPALMGMLGYSSKVEFKSCSGAVIKVRLNIESDACATIYYPDPAFNPSRATLTGNLIQIEIPLLWAGQNVRSVVESWADMDSPCYNTFIRPVLADFGIPSEVSFSWQIEEQKYAKILPVDDRERKRFIMWATDNFGIYSLGRFATWRPGLLLDDVFHDVQHIQSMIKNSNYSRRGR